MIEKLDFKSVYAREWSRNGTKNDRVHEQIQSEVLVPDYVSCKHILGIHVGHPAQIPMIKQLSPSIEVDVRPDFFFQRSVIVDPRNRTSDWAKSLVVNVNGVRDGQYLMNRAWHVALGESVVEHPDATDDDVER